MKHLVILILVAAFVTADRDPRCPVDQPGDEAFLLPHDTECSKYYICDSEGMRQEVDCDEGLHFNKDLKTCDWPIEECYIGCRPGVDNDHPTHLAHPVDCTKFYKCDDNNEPQLQECPEGLHWCAERDYCDYPEEAHCVIQLE